MVGRRWGQEGILPGIFGGAPRSPYPVKDAKEKVSCDRVEREREAADIRAEARSLPIATRKPEMETARGYKRPRRGQRVGARTKCPKGLALFSLLDTARLGRHIMNGWDRDQCSGKPVSTLPQTPPPQLPYPGSGKASYPTLMGSPASVFLPHTSCRTTPVQRMASTQAPCPPPHPWGLPPTINLLNHSHGPLTHPSSPWSQPLMTWPVPREKTKGWFWGRLLSNSVPSSSFPCGTMGRPVKRRLHSDTPPHPAAIPKLAPHWQP